MGLLSASRRTDAGHAAQRLTGAWVRGAEPPARGRGVDEARRAGLGYTRLVTLPARPVAGVDLAAELSRLGLVHVVTVPDTHQQSLLRAIAADPEFQLITACTEDEAVGICGGLYWGGREGVLIIQHAGLYASVNSLRGIGIDMEVPMLMLVGLYYRESDKPPSQSRSSMVRLAEPLLRTLDLPFAPLEGPEELGVVGRMHAEAWARRRPAAVLVGHATV